MKETLRNQYLTKERKKWYLEDFKNLLKIDNPIWKIDSNELKEILIKINSNEYIQTLYSKEADSKKEIGDIESYLEFAYNSNIELKLFREIISYFIGKYNSNDAQFESTCNFEFKPPQENPNLKLSQYQIGLKCTDDINYFKINRIRLTINSYNPNICKEFWIDLISKLMDIKPK